MLWPAAAAVSLSVALGGRNVSLLGLLLVACGTMAAYGLDRLIDKRNTDFPAFRNALLLCVLAASLATGILSCSAWWRIWVCSVLALIAGAYVPLKRIIPKNVLTSVAWTTATATLPFSTRPTIDSTFIASVVTVALIMLANTILCDIPDVTADRQAGVRGVIAKLLTQLADVDPQILAVLGMGGAPDRPQDHLLSDQSPTVAGQNPQQFELPPREVKGYPIHRGGMIGGVDPERPDGQD